MPFNDMLYGSLRTATSGGRTGFGQVPGPIGVPPNLFSQLSGAVPNLTANLGGVGSVIGSQLAGNVSPQTLNALKTGAAQFGVASGMPGSGLESNELFANIAGFSEGQQQKGVSNLLSQISALGPTMTNPNLAAEISSRNADFAAAPDPRLAAEEQFNLWLRGFNATRGGGAYGDVGRWPGGGTLGPATGFGASRSNWGGFGINPPDDLGFPGYNMTPEPQGVYTATATPPPGGWQTPPAWNAGFATSPYYYTGEEDFVPTNPGENPYP